MQHHAHWGRTIKILVERIKMVIGMLVGEEQNVFIKGIFILVRVLIANETFNYMKVRKKKS